MPRWIATAMQPLEAVLFDLDDTLVDTAAITNAAIVDTLTAVDCPITAEQINAHRITGLPLRLVYGRDWSAFGGRRGGVLGLRGDD